MPMITISTNLKITDDQSLLLKTKLGRVINQITNKNEAQLMLNFQQSQKMFFRGIEQDCALVHMQVYKAVTFEEKQAFTSKVTKSLCDILSLAISNIYIVIDEYENWGTAGVLK